MYLPMMPASRPGMMWERCHDLIEARWLQGDLE
jgi:hypothetical protein